MLSWIQSFIEMFKKADEMPDENHQLHKTIPPMWKENNKELNARITYQYPKGQFRFPVIPDNEKSINHHHSHHHQERKTADRKNRPQETHKKEQVSKSEPVVKNKYYSNGPFRPTEIPSPIFGFHRPKGPTVEHELSHFSKKTFDENKISMIISDSPKENKQLGDILTNTIDDEQDEIYASIQHGVEIPSNVVIPPTEDIQIMDEEKMSSEVLPKNNETAEADHLAVHQEKEILPKQIENMDAKDWIPVSNEKEMEKTAAVIAEEQMANKQKDAVFTADEAENANKKVNDKLLFEDPEKNKGQEHTEEQKTNRAHLPFNVLMLKQDKQKWEEKSRKKNEFLHQSPIESAGKEEASIEINTVSVSADYSEAGDYEFPGLQLLKPPVSETMESDWLAEQRELLNQTLENFNVGASVVNVTQGPSVTRFEVQPEPGVKVNKVTNLTDDIKLSLAARDIRMEAPIPGKHTIGIEVPNKKSRPVLISEIIHSRVFRESESPLTAVLGLDISGKPIVTDLKKMPHGLIAGATGSGKSVCINSILVSLLYKASPEDLKLLLIDPKMVELAPYNQIPHLVSPVITDVKAATAALKWAVDEMERRYELFAHTGVRDIKRFNELADQHKRYSDKLPFIVIVIDELADLMMMSPADVEEAICRIAQKARACGIHLIVATQRPSVDVITGLIKANIPTRIAFSVSSQVDSRTIIDISGAEKLLGRGDMLFLENGSSKPVRLQGTFVSDDEIDAVSAHVREQREPDYFFEQEELLKKAQVSEEEDELFYEACEFVVDQEGASTSSLQRRFKIGYNRAARLMDMMEQQGYISGTKGSKPRDVLITAADLETIQEASS